MVVDDIGDYYDNDYLNIYYDVRYRPLDASSHYQPDAVMQIGNHNHDPVHDVDN